MDRWYDFPFLVIIENIVPKTVLDESPADALAFLQNIALKISKSVSKRFIIQPEVNCYRLCWYSLDALGMDVFLAVKAAAVDCFCKIEFFVP